MLQISNAILGASCAFVLSRLLLQTFLSTYLSVVLTLLFSFSATWWKYATDADSYIPSLLLLLVCLNLIVGAKKPRPLLLALLHSASMLMHQLAVFFYPVVVLGIYLKHSDLPVRRRALLILRYSASASILTLAVNYYCFHLHTGEFNLAAFATWLTSYVHGPDSYSFSFALWNNITYTLGGQVKLFVGGRLNSLNGLISLPVIAVLGVLISIVCLAGFNIIQSARGLSWPGSAAFKLDEKFKPLAALCFLWVGAYLIFLFFWYPYFTPYRIFYLPPLILLLAIVLAQHQVLRTYRRKLVAALLVAAVAMSNFLFFIFPQSRTEKNQPLTLALEMNQSWTPGTVIYYASPSADNALFQYFNPSTRWERLKVVSDRTLEDQVSRIYKSGASVWIATSAFDRIQSSPDGSRWLSERTRPGHTRAIVNDAHRIIFVQIFPSGGTTAAVKPLGETQGQN